MLETAWLIERKDCDLCLGKAHGTGIMHNAVACTWVGFTDPNARRFPTREEAERYMRNYQLDG